MFYVCEVFYIDAGISSLKQFSWGCPSHSQVHVFYACHGKVTTKLAHELALQTQDHSVTCGEQSASLQRIHLFLEFSAMFFF